LIASQRQKGGADQSKVSTVSEWPTLARGSTTTVANIRFGKAILLRRFSGESMITIFDGGHESHPDVAPEWLSSKRQAVKNAPGKTN